MLCSRLFTRSLLLHHSLLSSVALSTMGMGSSTDPRADMLEGYAFPQRFPYTERDFRREDESKDTRFYAEPRFVTHIDDKAIQAITGFYKEVFKPGDVVLDLCSSWISHYPDSTYKEVVGVGMNEDELKANKMLSKYFVVDLNESPSLNMFEEAYFDTVTNAVSVDYLNKPLEVFKEMNRVLKPGGVAIMSFSNRCFPTKVINMWLRTDDEEHVHIVANYFHFSGFVDIKAFDISPGRGSDPMYVVLGKKAQNQEKDCEASDNGINKL